MNFSWSFFPNSHSIICQSILLLSVSKFHFLQLKNLSKNNTLNQSTVLIADILNKTRCKLFYFPYNNNLIVNGPKLNSIKEFIFKYSVNENWRMRENVLFILEGINSNLIRESLQKDINIDDVLPFFRDDNVYVVKMAKRCLKTALSLNPEQAGRFISQTKSDPNIILSSLYSFGYSIPSSLSSVSYIYSYKYRSQWRISCYQSFTSQKFQQVSLIIINSN